MNTFEITVQRRAGNAWPVVVEQRASGDLLPVRAEGLLQVGLEEFKTQLNCQSTPKEYGTLLGQAVFHDEVRDALVRALAKSNDRLHVWLFIEAPDLKGLRWERLCAPFDGALDFLALNQRVPFSLYLQSMTDRHFPLIGRRDLRALVVVANPEGLDKYKLAPFDATATVASIRTALGEIPADVLATVEGAIGLPTLDTLCTRITEEQYTLLHVVGHGQFKPGDGETILFLAGNNNMVEAVPGTRLLDRLKQLHRARGLPHFAFLSSCESAVAEEGNALGGLAQRLVSDLGMPAVLAMTEKVSIATAQALAEQFYRRLREHGELDRALVESCAGLAERHDVNVPALYSRLAGQPLFSLITDDKLKDTEIAHGLSRMEGLLPARAPVVLKVFQDNATTLRGLLATDKAQVSPAVRSEWEQALAAVNNLCTEALDLSFKALVDDQQLPLYDGRCPFRGLDPFKAEDRLFFFGRETWTTQLRKRLAEHKFLAVLGPSGSGKSSVVLAGVIPALQDEEPGLQLAYLTPGHDPLASLDSRVAAAHGKPTVLVVDQFEELFSLCTDKAVRRAFLDRLLGFEEKMRVIITMRADFWGECAPYPALRDRMRDHQELIPPMDLEELRQSMKKQAEAVKLQFETGLISTILDHVEGQPGAMPLLQHALLELWNRRHGRRLKSEEYQSIGLVQGAIAKTADKVYAALPGDSERQHMRDVFLRLTRLDEDAVQATARRDTRQRVQMDELTPAGTDPARTRVLLTCLADARLIVTSVNAATGREEVEVAHEALIRYWPRLRDWLDEDRTDLRVLASVRSAAREWQKNRSDESLLTHHGARLREGERLLAHTRLGLNQEEVEYLHACRNRQERQAKRERQYQRWIGGVSVAGAIIALSLAAWAWHLRNQAVQEKRETEITLAKELFRPLGRQPGGLNQAEASALTTLALLPKPQEHVRIRFVQQALAESGNARRFADRAPAAMQAAVGLNRGLAGQVAKVLRERLDNSAENMQTRTAAALAIAELDLADDELSELAAGVLLETLKGADQVVVVPVLTRNIVQATRHLQRDQAASYLDPVAKFLVHTLGKEPNYDAREALAHGLAEVCKALPPDRAATHLGLAAKLLAEALALPFAPNTLVRGLTEVCRAFPPDWAATHLDPAAMVLVAAVTKNSNFFKGDVPAGGLAEVCKALPPDRAVLHLGLAANLLAEGLAKGPKAFGRGEDLLRGLEEVCKAFPPDRAATPLDPAAKLLTAALTKVSDSLARGVIAHGLAVVCKAFPPDRAATHLDLAAKLLAEALAKESAAYARQALAGGLAAVCKAMPPDRAATHLGPAAKLLAEALAKESVRDLLAPDALARGLAEVCKALPPDGAPTHLDPVAKLLAEALAKDSNSNISNIALARGLADVCKARPSNAGKLLAEALAKDFNPYAREALARGLAEVCKVLPPDGAETYLGPAAKLMAEALTRDSNAFAREALAGGLAEVCKALPADKATVHLDAAAKLMAEALAKVSDSPTRYALARGLAEVCKALPPDKATSYLAAKLMAEVLAKALAKEHDSAARDALAHGLAEACKRLPPDKATQLLHGLAQYPEFQELFMPSLSEVAGTSSLQDAVEILKQALCFGEARKVFLSRVEQLVGQHFKTRWEMAAWVAVNHPEIDPASAPQQMD